MLQISLYKLRQTQILASIGNVEKTSGSVEATLRGVGQPWSTTDVCLTHGQKQKYFPCLGFWIIRNTEIQEWWCMQVIATLGRQRQENHKLSASLGYIPKPWLKTITTEIRFLGYLTSFHSLIQLKITEYKLCPGTVWGTKDPEISLLSYVRSSQRTRQPYSDLGYNISPKRICSPLIWTPLSLFALLGLVASFWNQCF